MVITAIKQQVKRPDRYSVFIDGKFVFGLSEQALFASGLASGQEVDSAKLEALKALAGTDKLWGNALRYAAMRPRSEWEVRSYLERKEGDDEQITEIITRLHSIGLLNDQSFAEMWVANRQLLKPSSLRKLRLELQQKRVPTRIIDSVLKDDQLNDRTALHDIVEKKRRRYPDEAKFMQYLARQGFRYDDIKAVLNDAGGEI